MWLLIYGKYVFFAGSITFDALTFSDSLLSTSSSAACTTQSQSLSAINKPSCPDLSPHASTSTRSLLPLVVNTTFHLLTSVTPAVPIPEHEGELRYISKYLIQYVPIKQKKISSTGKRATGARVLTSDECAQILVEQQEKKQKDLEEKEKRKADREQKKREKEEEARQKAEKRRKQIDRGQKINEKQTWDLETLELKKDLIVVQAVCRVKRRTLVIVQALQLLLSSPSH